MPFQRVITVVLSMLNHHHLVEQQEPMRMDSLPNIRLLCKALSSTYMEHLIQIQFQNIMFARLRRAKKRRRKRNEETNLIHSKTISIFMRLKEFYQYRFENKILLI